MKGVKMNGHKSKAASSPEKAKKPPSGPGPKVVYSLTQSTVAIKPRARRRQCLRFQTSHRYSKMSSVPVPFLTL